MAFLNCEVFSKTLNMATALRVILPDEGELGAADTVYLLHGLSDNSSGWTRYTAVEQFARERGLAVVMPEVQRSFYADMAAGLDYFSYVAVELPAMCERMFGLPDERAKRYVMGLSMGGYGALKCVLTYPERYAGAGSFSGVVDIRRPVYSVNTPERARERRAIFGADGPEGTKNDLYRLAQDVFAEKKNFPGIYLSCGEQDGLYEDNVKFDAFLTSLGAEHRFDHRAGAHTWRFWNDSVEDCFGYFFGE